MSKIKNYFFIFFLAVLFNAHVQAFDGGGGNEEDVTESLLHCNLDESNAVCHAWGLEWQLIVDTDGGEVGGSGSGLTVDVHNTFDSYTDALDCANGTGTGTGDNPECKIHSKGWRLPNIRELSKLFRYTPIKDDNGHYIEEIGNTALTYATMRNWFKTKYFKPESTTIALSDANGDITAGIEPYLLSSTYRDLDSNDNNADVQVLAMNLMTGAIESVTRGAGGGSFAFCPIGRKDGQCGGVTSTRDKAINPIFVIKVKTFTET